MNNLLTPEELAVLAQKVKNETATEEETIQYLEIVNGLSGEFLDVLKSMPTDNQLNNEE